MLISRFDEVCVMMWGYFNPKGQGNFIRNHSILIHEIMTLKIKICLPLWEFNIGVS